MIHFCELARLLILELLANTVARLRFPRPGHSFEPSTVPALRLPRQSLALSQGQLPGRAAQVGTGALVLIAFDVV